MPSRTYEFEVLENVMAADLSNHPGEDEGASTDFAIDHAQRALKETLATAERRLSEAANSAERAIRHGIETLRVQTRAYAGPAGQSVDDAQRYMIERVKERPVTATLAGLGVGLLLGLLLSSRGK